MTQRLKRIRQLPCCNCHAPSPSQAAHSNFYEHGKGRGIKADDRYTIPLCHDCHRKFDTYSMGMSRAQSKVWFDGKVKFIDKVLYGSKDKTVL